MTTTRYCSTCGTLLPENAAVCGECGARYQASPYERRATDAPGAWSAAPRARARDLGPQETESDGGDGIELISREELAPKEPGATTLRPPGQYDRAMVTQPPQNPTTGSASFGSPSGPGSAAPAPSQGAPASQGPAFEPPLDGCAPSTAVKRLLAAVIDGVVAGLVTVPMTVGVILLLTQESASLLAQILMGVGAALPVAYALVMVWLTGSKGFTVGKLVMGLRIVRESTGGPLGFVRALGRWVVYGVISPVMALSILLDAQKRLRGFHDRVVGSVVVDVKSGRNPLTARADGFERAPAEQYLGAPSVAVSAHQNLLSEPGSAWQGGAPAQQDASAGAAPQTGGWDPQPAPSPYAPPSASSATDAPAQDGWGAPAPSAPAQDSGSWAPPPVEPAAQTGWDQTPAPQAPAQQAGWGQTPAPHAPDPQQSGWDQGSASQAPAPQQTGWGSAPEPAPAPQPAPEQQWGPPAPAEPAAQSWDAPSQPSAEVAPEQGAPAPAGEPQSAPGAQPWDRPAESAAPSPAGAWGAPAPSAPAAQPPAPAQDAPHELTGSAWDGGSDEVDEATRMSVPEDDSLGDLEATRISPVKLPPKRTLRLVTDAGTERVVERAVVIGRNPTAPAGELLFVLQDDTRSVSKTHLLVDGTGDETTVTDLGSTNGSAIVREDGSREGLVPHSPTVLPAGAQVALGDRTLSVEREQ
ncbi:RDD family protein [Brachybacterium sp. J144]|uniref:RDD family protein n=1 Tax=Brachybacterium sp. J144 TaxID=3116487 RepID=UPI002E782516|nr:RDD family protein [Brachybacterium sp. J144]MEE1649511.1 RDD family protein [Brachybacterium sp. J144]